MKSALIGFTGFVGGNITNQTRFTDYYNSRNINDIIGKKYDLIVSAGTSSLKWKANLEPKKDWENIKKLLENLKKVKTNHFILISTVDVYPNHYDVDENTKIDYSKLSQAYGRNRYRLEKFVKEHFKNTTIICLPQLFGPGLKKNFAFDLIHNNRLDLTHKDTKFQWYNLKNIWHDIGIAVKNSLPVVNFAVEPITAKELAKYSLGLNFDNVTKNPPLCYDVRTKYGYLYGTNDIYLYHREETLAKLKKFILDEKKRL